MNNNQFKLQLTLKAVRTAEELEKTMNIIKLKLNLEKDHLFQEVYYAETFEVDGLLKIEVWPVKEGILGRRDGYIQWFYNSEKLNLMKIRKDIIDEYEQELLSNSDRWIIKSLQDDYDNDSRTIII